MAIGIGVSHVFKKGGVSWSAYWATRKPTDLIAITVTSTRIDLSWTSNSAGDETGFNIERSVDGITFAQIDTVLSGVTTYSDISATANHYYYRVRARKGGSYSGYTNEAFNVVPLLLYGTNTVAWFDARDLATITKDGGNLVAQWNDKSGNGNNLLQATAMNKPVWVSDYGGILFDGGNSPTGDELKTAPFTYEQPEHIYLCLKQVAYDAIDRGYLIDGDANSTGVIYQNTDTPELMCYAGNNSSSNANLAIGAYGILKALFNGAASKFQINKTSAVTGDFGDRDMGAITIGQNGATTSNSANIQILEGVFRNVVDGSPNEDDIYNYLNFHNTFGLIGLTRYASNPIVSYTETFEGTALGDPVVIEEETELRMYYSGFRMDNINAIGLATSPKTYPPTTWTKQGIVFEPNPIPGQWDSGWVRMGNIVKVGLTYYLYYEATPDFGETGTMQIGLATSTDGLTFIRNAANPILTPTVDEIHVENPSVVEVGGTWYMYYSYRTEVLTLPGIRVATSSDGISWTKIGTVLSIGVGGTWDDYYIEHAQIYYINNLYVLIYEGYDGAEWRCGCAYSADPVGTFTKDSNSPFFAKSGTVGSFDEFHIATPSLFFHGNKCYLFYQGGDTANYMLSQWKLGIAY